MKSPALALFLDCFKAAAAEGAVSELKLRLLAGTVPGLQKYAHEQNLGNIEDDLAAHFGDTLSVAEKEMLRVCRQLRNKVLHSDFRAARSKLDQLGVATNPGGVLKIDLLAGADDSGACEETRRCKSGNGRPGCAYVVHERGRCIWVVSGSRVRGRFRESMRRF